MRVNVYKKKILALLSEKHLLTLAEIHAHIKSADYSTVFRNTEQLLKEGSLRKVLLSDKSVAYEKAGVRHDHFICTSCGKVTSIQVPLVAKTIHAGSISDVTVRGICTACT